MIPIITVTIVFAQKHYSTRASDFQKTTTKQAKSELIMKYQAYSKQCGLLSYKYKDVVPTNFIFTISLLTNLYSYHATLPNQI